RGVSPDGEDAHLLRRTVFRAGKSFADRGNLGTDMDALTAAGLCALLAAPPQAAQPCGRVAEISNSNVDHWQSLIEAASARFGIPADWIRAVMARESAGLTALHGAPIVSPAGAMGLMQLMPGTWSDMRTRYGFGNDPFDPQDNIFAGTAYLREMFER